MNNENVYLKNTTTTSIMKLKEEERSEVKVEMYINQH